MYLENGTIGHITWLYYSKDPNRLLRLAEKECEIKFCLTLPQFRGRGLYPAALRSAQQFLRKNGFERCFICVRHDNHSSIRGIMKAGFVFVGEIRLRKWFGFQISRRSDTSKLSTIQAKAWQN